jgi:hypothetical protein
MSGTSRFLGLVSLAVGALSCSGADPVEKPGTTCAELECPANGSCDDSSGSAKCVCEAGYEISGTSCVEVDECAAGTDDCVFGAVCTNLQGDYTCSCEGGYEGDGRSGGSGCQDVDECAQGADDCIAAATCENDEGSFQCHCPAGFAGDGTEGGTGCPDVDECETALDDCVSEATCTNSEGSFECECPEGYEGDAREGGTGCTDVDECADGIDECVAEATCDNQDGGYVCVCPMGYAGDGLVGGVGCVDAFDDPPEVDNVSNQSGTVGVPFSFTPVGSDPEGLALTWSVSAGTLPNGLSLDPASGSITGTPTAASLYAPANGSFPGLTLSASDGASSTPTNTFSITIQGVAAIPTPTTFWSMDTADLSGFVLADGASSNDLTLTGTLGVAGAVGEARRFDGTTSDGDAGDVLDAGASDLTVVASYRSSASTGAGALDYFSLVANGGVGTGASRYFLYLDRFGANNLEFSLDDDTTLAIAADPSNSLDGAWHVAVGVRDGTANEVRVYRDGEARATASATGIGSVDDATYGMHVGCVPNADGAGALVGRMNGDIDEVGVWVGTALTEEQIATLHWLRVQGVSMQSWIGF